MWREPPVGDLVSTGRLCRQQSDSPGMGCVMRPFALSSRAQWLANSIRCGSRNMPDRSPAVVRSPPDAGAHAFPGKPRCPRSASPLRAGGPQDATAEACCATGCAAGPRVDGKSHLIENQWLRRHEERHRAPGGRAGQRQVVTGGDSVDVCRLLSPLSRLSHGDGGGPTGSWGCLV